MSAKILKGLDSIALALTDTGHVWTESERKAYEAMVRMLKR